MITVTIRKQGGAAIMTIPADILKMLNLDIGATLALEIVDGGFSAQPLQAKNRKRYTLKELLRDVTPDDMKEINAATEWARDVKPVGREKL